MRWDLVIFVVPIIRLFIWGSDTLNIRNIRKSEFSQIANLIFSSDFRQIASLICAPRHCIEVMMLFPFVILDQFNLESTANPINVVASGTSTIAALPLTPNLPSQIPKAEFLPFLPFGNKASVCVISYMTS